MTRNEIKELLPILQAFAEGKTIQSRYIKGDKTLWYDISELVDEDFNDYEYRIKPEPKYRPFENAEECWNEMLKHQPFGWLKAKYDGYLYQIMSIKDANAFDVIYKDCTFADGSVFGKLEED